MALSSQCYIYSVGSDAFYQEDERAIHKKLNALHGLKRKVQPSWKLKSINQLLNKLKKKLSNLLDSRIDTKLIRELNQEEIIARNVISLFESSLTRACEMKSNELSTKIVQVEFYFYQVMKDLIDNGFDYDGKHYVYFSSSAGAIRKHRGLFIEEALYESIKLKLTCGLTVDKINQVGGCVINKWLAYLALSSSATDVWKGFDIDKAIVCEDYELPVHGMVDYIDAADYSITRKEMDVNIPMNDGVGMMLDETTRVIRGPFIKGLMVTFPFDKFLKEKCTPDQWIVSDIYGIEHNVIKEGIKYILTKSQFKMAKYYSSWEEYKANFKKYGCEICYCNMERSEVPKAQINYQMLNSLSDMTDEEIEKLTKLTDEDISSIGENVPKTLKLLGATEYNQNKIPFQKALIMMPELLHDSYGKEKLKQIKKSLVKQAKAGRLRVNGFYRQASPDLYAYCERLFLDIQEPEGLLKDGEVSSCHFRNGEEVDCLRSPHLYFEHCLRTNVQTDEIRKWFTSKCVYTSCNDLISRVLALDWDGDILLLTNDKVIKQVVKRNQEKFVPLYFEMRKANPVEINSTNIYDGLIAAFRYGKIGIYSNACAKIWNSGEITQDSLDALKLLVAESNWSIDAAKCLYMPQRPEKAAELITRCTKGKLPNFFLYAKDKENEQVEKPNGSTMNRIAQSIPSYKVHFPKTLGKLDYRKMMNLNESFGIKEEDPVIQAYNYWLRHQYLLNISADNHVGEDDMYIYKVFIRNKILEDSGKPIDYVVNTLVAYLYTVRKSSQKKMLWACFGDEIVKNMEHNLANADPICPICGRRFKPRANANQTYCGDKCYNQYEKERKRLLASRLRESSGNENTIKTIINQ